MKKDSQKKTLRKLGIRHFDKPIHDQPRAWLLKHFSKGAEKYPVNVSLLMRNVIWQTRERIVRKEKPPLKELIRTFWYMYIKPTLSRAGALSEETDQYAQLIDTLVDMVKKWNIFEYKDIGFRDEKQANRKVGFNANVILFAEKIGHQGFLTEMADRYNISILALGGQPSLLNVEYFVDELKANKIDIRRSFYIFSVVDYDTSGWIIRDAFIKDLKHYGVKNVRVTDLIHPDMLTPKEIRISRYRIPKSDSMTIKNKKWMQEVHKRNYVNQKYLEDVQLKRTILYGLEAESISSKRLSAALEKLMVPLLGKSEDLLQLYELKQLDQAIKNLALFKMFE